MSILLQFNFARADSERASLTQHNLCLIDATKFDKCIVTVIEDCVVCNS